MLHSASYMLQMDGQMSTTKWIISLLCDATWRLLSRELLFVSDVSYVSCVSYVSGVSYETYEIPETYETYETPETPETYETPCRI